MTQGMNLMVSHSPVRDSGIVIFFREIMVQLL